MNSLLHYSTLHHSVKAATDHMKMSDHGRILIKFYKIGSGQNIGLWTLFANARCRLIS